MKTGISHILDLLAGDPETLLIYVFGSAATDTSHALSDIDIALLLPQREPEYFIRKENELLLLAEQGVGNVDILVLNVAGIELQHKIITAGKLLFSRTEADRAGFEERVLLSSMSMMRWFSNASSPDRRPLREWMANQIRS